MTQSALTPDIDVQLQGLLGDALAANRRGRLFHFIQDETSPAVALFERARAATNVEGDWYGEHAGKWLVAAAKSAARSGDAALADNVRRVADFLCDQQEPDGYLGTYAPERRFMVKQPPKPGTWDGAPSVRTWDIWTHAYLVLGLLEAHRHFGEPRWLAAARRIGDLCWATLSGGQIGITELGNHHGLSATVLLDPAVELFVATGEARYLDLARLVLQQADADPDLALLQRARAGADASEIATGKAYQLAWNLVGLAKLVRASGESAHRDVLDRLWQSIRMYHLTLGGGPWGGVALRSRECFNPAGVFSPQGYVETCSTLAWIQLNRELLAITLEPKYAEEIERSAWNDLLGAAAENGEDWCYYSFPNGQRVHTTYWRCCKSSGAMALEELPAITYTMPSPDEISVNLYGPGRAVLPLAQAGTVRIEQSTQYPFDGAVALRMELEQEPERAAHFALRLRIPSWAGSASVKVNGRPATAAVVPGTYCVLERAWNSGDLVELNLPMPVRTHRRINQNTQESRAPDGTAVRQQVLHQEFLAITRGPLVYATGLIDGYKPGETIRVPQCAVDEWLEVLPAAADAAGPTIRMTLAERAPLLFTPYYRTGDRLDGAWRITWLQLAPQESATAAVAATTEKNP
jgi:DUF1680 family protein